MASIEERIYELGIGALAEQERQVTRCEDAERHPGVPRRPPERLAAK